MLDDIQKSDLDRALSVFEEFYPSLRAAMDREATSWKVYEQAGINNITPAMVKERQAATKGLNLEWRKFICKVGWSIAREKAV